MKKIKFLLAVMIFIMVSQSAFSQKYKTAADTVKLNEEYIKVSNEITDLTSKLTIAQNNLPGYNSRANTAVSDAQSTSVKSSEQASKATNGDLGDARKAKKNARQALKDAKGARRANNKVKDQEKKIAKLSSQLQKKQERLQELEVMRTAIRNTKQ
jgi:CRISPR/Cas system-associated endonuclease Cas3-HD